MQNIQVLSRVAAPLGSRTDTPVKDLTSIRLIYRENGAEIQNNIRIGCPTRFDEITVATFGGEARPPEFQWSRQATWKGKARILAKRVQDTLTQLRRVTQHAQPIIDLRRHEPNNMAHMLLGVLPICLYAQQSAGFDVTPLINPLQTPYADLIDLFPIQPLITRQRVSAKIVELYGVRGLAAYELQHTPNCPPLAFLPDIYEGIRFDTDDPIENIFIARKGIRTLANQEDVERVLQARGYVTVYMEDYSVKRQLEIAANAKNVVAIHGAAMALLVLNPIINSVIELQPAHAYHQLYPLCLGRRTKNYSVLLPEYNEAIAHSDWSTISTHKNGPFEVDITSLERSLSEV